MSGCSTSAERGDGGPGDGDLAEAPAARTVQQRPAVRAQCLDRGDEPLPGAVRRVRARVQPRPPQGLQVVVHGFAGDVAVDERLGQAFGDGGRVVQRGQP